MESLIIIHLMKYELISKINFTVLGHVTVVRRQEIHMSEEELELLVAKWNFTWVYFTLDGLSVYTAAKESVNVGLKLTSFVAEVGIRKVTG